ncbi:MAG TPA: hypothetical protein VFC03_04080 [Acidimicrobiales bacterium]|nr:hypothetical protein [Acidimicrobiales bacterium]
MTTDELMDQACPLIRDHGWAYFFVPETEAKGKELGLDVFQFYVLGRGGVLGNVEASVVASAFGYFNPSMIQQLWDSGRKLIEPRDAARAYFECAAELGRLRFAGLGGLEGFCAAAGAVNDAADPTGLPLYAGFRAEPLVDDAAGRAMQLLSVLREFRGSAHLLAVRAEGIDSRTAHLIKRPNDAELFGWSADDLLEITPEDREALDRAEVLTDSIVRSAYAVLGDAGAEALLAGLDEIVAALNP